MVNILIYMMDMPWIGAVVITPLGAAARLEVLLCGYPPFFGDTDSEVLAKVRAPGAPRWVVVSGGLGGAIASAVSK